MENIFNYGIMSMPNLSPSEKLVVMQIAISKSLGITRLNVTKAAEQIGYTRHGWQKVAKRLIEKGFVENPKRGYYKLSETNVF